MPLFEAYYGVAPDEHQRLEPRSRSALVTNITSGVYGVRSWRSNCVGGAALAAGLEPQLLIGLVRGAVTLCGPRAQAAPGDAARVIES